MKFNSAIATLLVWMPIADAFSLLGQCTRHRVTRETSLFAVDESHTGPSTTLGNTSTRRQMLLGGFLALGTVAAVGGPLPSNAAYVMDEETGEYVEVQDVDWQTTWKQRLDKASSMSQDEIFQAARGAGNVNLKEGIESDASKKRRAMSACRDSSVRQKAQAGDEKECTARVFGGEVDFLLEAL